MGSQLFGPLKKDTSIKVGYIDGDNGFVDGLSVCEANEYARLNPGTVFIFRTGDRVLKYLNINEVNALTVNDVLGDSNCAGVNQKVVCGPPKIDIRGGGGIGAVGNPIVGSDGSILAVDIVRTGHGYAFAPEVITRDECNLGSGTILRAVLGELVIAGDELVIESEGSVSYGLNFRNDGSIRGYRGGSETYLYQYYDRAEDYEEYFLCDDETVPFGTLWGPNGENLGEWKPTVYIGGSDPILREIEEYQRDVRALEGGFFNTRKTKPSKIYSNNPTISGEWYPVLHPGWSESTPGGDSPPLANQIITWYRERWGRTASEKEISDWIGTGLSAQEIKQRILTHSAQVAGYVPNRNSGGTTIGDSFMNRYAVSPKPPSNVKGSDFAGTLFIYEWNLDFPTTGDYRIRGAKDNIAKLFIDNQFVSELDGFRGKVNEIKRYYEEGLHTVRVELLNVPIYETKTVDLVENQVAGVDFVQKSDGIYMKVGGNIDTEVVLMLEYNDDPETAGTAVTRIEIPNSPGRPNMVLQRKKSGDNWEVSGRVQVKEIFAQNEEGYGPISFQGTSKNPKLSAKNTFYGRNSRRFHKIDFFDRHGSDVNAKLNIISATNLQQSRTKPAPPSSEIVNTEVFNTVDWIGKANRKLWRTNVYGGGGFLNQYGVCPFDTSVTIAELIKSWYRQRWGRTASEKEISDWIGTGLSAQEIKQGILAHTAQVAGYIPHEGTHTIVWSNVKFPEDGNYTIEVEVDDNVNLTFESSTGKKLSFRRNGFKPNTDKGLGKLTRTDFFEKGTYTITAELEQISGGVFAFSPIKGTNPMALAVRVTYSAATVSVISPKSWNENPMGVALVIDAPDPIVPQEPPPVQEGRCPPNPIWTTRTSGAKEQWYPVTHVFGDGTRSWSKFTNRYAISPIKPLAQPNTDSGGITFSNSWTVEIPFDGYYGLKATADNGGRILIDGQEQISGGLGFKNTKPRVGGFNQNSPETKKIFLNEGTHTIDVEVSNETTITYNTVEQKIFNTLDWSSTKEDTTPTQAVKFTIKTNSGGSKGVYIERTGLNYSKGETPKSPQLDLVHEEALQVGVIYEVVFTGGGFKKLRNKGDQIIEVEDAFDNDYNDLVISSSIGRFYNIRADRCSFVIGAPKETQVSKTVGGVTYSGPELFKYTHPEWSKFMNNNSASPFLPPLDGENINIIGTKTYVWDNVDFPEDGQYIIKFQADNIAKLFIDGDLITQTSAFKGDAIPSFTNVSKGKRQVKIELENVSTERNIFNENPVGVALKITKKVKVRGDSRSWAENPIGISAVLIAPPCPRRIDGRGIVTDVIVEEPGNGYISPSVGPEGYPVLLKLKEVLVKDTGINYNCGIDRIEITPSNGAVLEYECLPFGKIAKVNVINPGMGFTEYPTIRMISDTGVNFEAVPLFEVVRDPVEALTGAVPPDKLIQVTDLVGLKQTGYVDGRAYYGAVFYKEGVRYAGYYETAGQLVQIYDTLQESIDAQVTTAPSAIQRQGTDTNSNNPRLNLPGTPENLI